MANAVIEAKEGASEYVGDEDEGTDSDVDVVEDDMEEDADLDE